jgi:hypothetical protein
VNLSAVQLAAGDDPSDRRVCTTCDRRHEPRWTQDVPPMITWADRGDGHPFKRESWERYGRRMAARVAVLEAGG